MEPTFEPREFVDVAPGTTPPEDSPPIDAEFLNYLQSYVAVGSDPLGKVLVCTSQSRPTSAKRWQLIFETDTKLVFYNASEGAAPEWVVYPSDPPEVEPQIGGTPIEGQIPYYDEAQGRYFPGDPPAPGTEIPAEYLTEAEGDERYARITGDPANGQIFEWDEASGTLIPVDPPAPGAAETEVLIQSIAPAPQETKLWVDTGSDPVAIKYYDGAAWVAAASNSGGGETPPDGPGVQPQYVAVSQVLLTTNASSVQLPAVASLAGQVLLAQVMSREPLSAIPSGWTQVWTQNIASSGVTQYSTILKRDVEADNETMPTVNFSGSSGRVAAATVAITGGRIAQVVHALGDPATGNNTITISPDVSEAESLLLTFFDVVNLGNPVDFSAEANGSPMTQIYGDDEGNRIAAFWASGDGYANVNGLVTNSNPLSVIGVVMVGL